MPHRRFVTSSIVKLSCDAGDGHDRKRCGRYGQPAQRGTRPETGGAPRASSWRSGGTGQAWPAVRAPRTGRARSSVARAGCLPRARRRRGSGGWTPRRCARRALRVQHACGSWIVRRCGGGGRACVRCPAVGWGCFICFEARRCLGTDGRDGLRGSCACARIYLRWRDEAKEATRAADAATRVLSDSVEFSGLGIVRAEAGRAGTAPRTRGHLRRSTHRLARPRAWPVPRIRRRTSHAGWRTPRWHAAWHLCSLSTGC